MTAPRRRRAAPAPPAPSNAAIKGLILVAMAVLLGAGLLLKSFDDGGPFTVTPTGPAVTSTTVGGGPTTATTTEVAHDPATVKVLVLNGVDKDKAIAGPAAQTLKSANYTTLAPSDAPITVTSSAVYYLVGYGADATAIAAALGIPATAVAPVPNPVPPSVGDVKEANVVVVVGPDAGVIGSTTATTAAN
ncbi:MAG: LytR C-terminal domain-containing protein [Acidimicrobiales bacterium]